ncbi:MAG: molybdenum cofactor guanylyltransferase [Candidatus Bathyarchaeia archaeon]|jgi:molybdopterin-guanine dinucleotide biosynthesis protein A
MAKRAALILAGGKARRFQVKGGKWEDKALATLAGKPLLVHAVENVQGVVDKVAVSVSDEERGARYAEILKTHGLKVAQIVLDEKTEISGPTVAIMSGLKRVQADYCLTLPCDMPFLQPEVADYLFRQAQGFDVAVPMWPNGRLETLLNVIERQNGLEITETLCKLKRPRSDDIQRGAGKILLASTVGEIKALDPELESFVNINSKEDLKQPRTRLGHGPVQENLQLNLGSFSTSGLNLLRGGAGMVQEGKLAEAQSVFSSCTRNFEAKESFFWAGVSGENQGEALLKLSEQQHGQQEAVELDFEGKDAFLRAANNYRVEAEWLEENRCRLLAERAFSDKAWCESWAMGKHSHAHRYPPKVA